MRSSRTLAERAQVPDLVGCNGPDAAVCKIDSERCLDGSRSDQHEMSVYDMRYAQWYLELPRTPSLRVWIPRNADRTALPKLAELTA